ncbi:uncharacterized protein DDB_G0283357-like [Saccostrea cucullata]|uniref:uncharacterized protein DDB_G0283357-like n=1 Tax=Saccostrea cuccullata TaxID=36930 RepID=UPI002ED04FFF
MGMSAHPKTSCRNFIRIINKKTNTSNNTYHRGNFRGRNKFVNRGRGMYFQSQNQQQPPNQQHQIQQQTQQPWQQRQFAGTTQQSGNMNGFGTGSTLN